MFSFRPEAVVTGLHSSYLKDTHLDNSIKSIKEKCLHQNGRLILDTLYKNKAKDILLYVLMNDDQAVL